MSGSEVNATLGRPRDPSIEPRVVSAAIAELAEHGIRGFSMNRVAGRADVDKRSIASRWADRRSLLADALATLVADVRQADTDSLRGDLEQLMPMVAEVFSSPRMDILTRALLEAREDPDLYGAVQRDLLDHSSAIVEHAFRQAARRRELRPGVDPAWATDAFMGLVMVRGRIHRRDLPAQLTAADQALIIEHILQGVLAQADPDAGGAV